jgi:hypothetical protein
MDQILAVGQVRGHAAMDQAPMARAGSALF